MVPEIVDGGRSQVADTEQDEDENKPEKPYKRMDQEIRIHHPQRSRTYQPLQTQGN